MERIIIIEKKKNCIRLPELLKRILSATIYYSKLGILTMAS